MSKLMSKPKLPSRAGDIWEGGFIFDAPREVQAIEARGGLVVAGGADHYLLRPGDETWKVRPPPEDIGPIYAVAAEPRGARRYAVASQKMFAMFMKTPEGDQILRIKPEGFHQSVRHLAWGGDKGPCALYVLHNDATLRRMRPDLSDFEELDIDQMSALASDDNGVVAMVTLPGDETRVYVTRDGVQLMFRQITETIDETASFDLAVADTAVALVVDEQRVLLSRGKDDPFVPVEALASPEGKGWKTGPIVFQGSSSDSALLCARWENDLVRIIRVDASGAATSIVEMEGTPELDPPEVVGLSWDASRQTLWGASPYVGIFKSVAPGPKGKKKALLS